MGMQCLPGGQVTGHETPGWAETTESKAMWFIGGGAKCTAWGQAATCHSPQEWQL